jgi:hypothetical protein
MTDQRGRARDVFGRRRRRPTGCPSNLNGLEQLETRSLLSATLAAVPRAITVVKPVVGLVTSEDGRNTSFTVVLKSQPTHEVAISLESSNPGEGVPNVPRLFFTPENWSTPQRVVVTGVSDGVRDGNKKYQIITGAAASDDPAFDGKPVPDVQLVNRDSKTLVAGVKVFPQRGLVTTADGGGDYFNIVLTYKPSADVTIPISSSNTSAGLPSVTSVTFTPENWDYPQQVTMAGQGGSFSGRDTVYKAITGRTISEDPRYRGIDPDDVMVRNIARFASRFIGSYVGTMTGSMGARGRRLPFNETLRFDVKEGGNIILYGPVGPGIGGSGRVLGNSGAITMQADIPGNVFEGMRFVGNFSIADVRNARGNWQFSRLGVTGSGMWNVSRSGGTNPAG